MHFPNKDKNIIWYDKYHFASMAYLLRIFSNWIITTIIIWDDDSKKAQKHENFWIDKDNYTQK